MGHAAAVKQDRIRGRGRGLWMVAMAAVLVLAGSLIVATERAGAQSSTTLVSNLGRGNPSFNAAGSIFTNNLEYATSFTTGTSDHGYGLASVTLQLGTIGGRGAPTPEVAIHSDNNGSPGGRLFTFDNPSNIGSMTTSAADYTFSAASHPRLRPNTVYWLAVYASGNPMHVLLTSIYEENSDWNIDDLVYFRPRGTSSSHEVDPDALRMKLEGVVITPTRVESSDEDLPYSDQTWGYVDTSASSSGPLDATLYTVQWKESGDAWTNRKGVTEVDVTGTSHVISGLTDGTEYAVRVFATRDGADSAPSEEVIAMPRETTPPELSSAGVDGAELTLTFNEALDTDMIPDTSAFAVTVAGGGRGVDAVAVSGSVVTLTLVTPVFAGDAVTVDYTAPPGDSASRLKDLAGNAAASFSGQDVTNDTQAADPMTATTHDVPSAHDGSTTFTFELRFSETPREGFSYKTLRDHAFMVTGGEVVKARRLEKGKNVRWEISVRPDGDGAVTIVLPATTDCEADGAVCTDDGRKLSPGLEFEVPGLSTPETGQGYASFDSRVEGSSHKSTNGYRMTIDVRTEHDSVPPALAATNAAVLAADGKTLTLTYNEPMKETSTPANSAFTVEATPAGGSEAEVELAATNGVSVSGSTVVLKLDNPIAHNDGSVKVTYNKPGSGMVIEDEGGNEAPGFTDQLVTNNSAIPRVSIEALFPDASPVIANPAFKFTRSNTGVGTLRVALEMSQTGAHLGTFVSRPSIPASDTEVDANVVTFDFGAANTINTNGMMTLTVIGGDDHLPALAPNNSATIEIKVPAMGPTVRIEFQEDAYTIDEGIGNLVLEVVSIIAPGVAAPRHETTLRAAVLTQDYVPGLPREETATINVDYTHISVNVSMVVGDWTCIPDQGCTHTANVNVPILEDDKHERDEKFRYYLDDTPGQSSLFRLDTTRRIITILDNDPLVVTDVTVSSTPTNGYYDADDSIEFTVPFNGSVTVTGTPQLTFDLGGQTRQANYTSGSDTEELLFTYTVTASDVDDHDGISWGANALGLNGGTIKFTSADVNSRVDADLAHPARGPLPDHKVDATKPSLVSASLDGTTLTMTFSEDLDETAAPANTVFTVKVGGGTGSNPTAVSISGSVVTLTLANAVASGQTVTVSYAKPATNPLKDLSGKEAGGFVDNDVSVDPPPEFPNATETFTVVENTTSGTVGTVTATDPENQTVVYSVEGTGADDFNHDFSLDSSTGAITVKSDATIDFETKSSYTVSIKATDTAGSNSAVEVTINVTNADDVGSVELSAGTPALSEPVTASVSDQDIPVTVQSWSWGRGTTRTGSFSLISGEDTASYTPVQQDLGMFLRASASYTDSFGSGKSAQATSFAVSAIPLVNVAPQFEDASVTITIAEMSPAGDVGLPVMAEDRNGHTVTYAIRKRGDPDYDSLSRHGDSFTIDSGTGQLKIKDQPDYERRHRYYVTVTATEPITTTDPIAATDPVGLSDSVNVMVLVTNLDDPGTVTLRSANPRVDSDVSARLRDPDGVSSEVVGWVWSRGDSMEGSFTAIAGATDDLYVPTQDDFGKYLRAAATYDDAHGPGKSAEGTSSLPVNTSQRFPVRIEILFDSSAYRAKEGGVVATVRLIAQRDHFQDIKETAQAPRRLAVPLNVSYGGGATASDHSVIPTEVIFQKGDSERTFRVIATPDEDNDDGEWINISLGMLPEEDSVYPGRRTAARVHLDDADDDLTTINVSFDSASYTASKGNEVTVTLQLDKAFVDRDSLNVSVYHALDDDGDYTLRYDRGGTTFAGYASPTTFSFRSGQTERSFRISCDQGNVGGENTTVSLRLSQASLPASTSVGSRGEATVTCTDPPMGPPMAEVRFGKGYYLTPEDGNAVRPSIVLSRALNREVTIPIVHSPQMGATAADYTISPTSVTFSAGETRKYISALATDDDDDDDGEYVLLTFGTLPSVVTEASGMHEHDLRSGWQFARKTSRLILQDNDATPSTTTPPTELRSVTVFFDEPSYSAGEGEFATVKVKLYSDPERRVVVPIVIKSRGPGASAYTLTQNAVFEADSTEFTFRFETIDDNLDNDEGAWVELGFGTLPNKVRAHSDRNTTRINVVDNDHPELTASFHLSRNSINEVHYSAPEDERALGETTVTVTLSADPEREVLIPIKLTLKNGGGGDDFYIQGNAFRINKKDGDDHGTVLLRFRPSDPLSQTFDVKAWKDRDYDPGEWIDISFESMPEGVSAGPSARVNIVDDDPGTPVAVRVDITASQGGAEDGGPAIVEVSLRQSADHDVVIPLVLSRLGGATASDHSEIPESLTFAAGETTKTFEVLATDDQDDDDGEWLEITIGQLPENFRVSNVAHTAVVNLTDND